MLSSFICKIIDCTVTRTVILQSIVRNYIYLYIYIYNYIIYSICLELYFVPCMKLEHTMKFPNSTIANYQNFEREIPYLWWLLPWSRLNRLLNNSLLN